MVLVWGVRRAGPPDVLQRARWLFDFLNQEQAQVIMPAVSVSEYLCKVPIADHKNVLAALAERFILAPFETRAAAFAAELFDKGKAERVMGEGARVRLRNDCLVVASAKAAGAEILYSHDGDCRSLARHIMQSADLPEMPTDLFGYMPSVSVSTTALPPPSLQLPSASPQKASPPSPSLPLGHLAAPAQQPQGSSLNPPALKLPHAPQS